MALNAAQVGFGAAVLAGVVLAIIGHPGPKDPPPISQPTPERGEVIATKGAGDSVPACAQCHLQNGVTDGSGTFPRLAGQSAWYMARQFTDYASGVRSNPIMEPIAKALSADDRIAVSAYFANASGPYTFSKPADRTSIERGRQLARVGDEAKTLQACNNCHGPGGTGAFPAIPYLAGQYADYTIQQLQAWQAGTRKTSPESMAEIAKRLSADDIAAVAAFYQQLREAPAQAAK